MAAAFVALSSCASSAQRVILGDERFDEYLPILEGQRVALLSNQTGIVGDKVLSGGIDERWDGKGDRSLIPFGEPVTGPHLLDVLLEKKVDVTAIFSPEHGFRGKADAGAKVESSVDEATGVPILSLYGGGGHSPSEEAMNQFDILVVDIQDVGLRFYTYYVTMYHMIRACALHGKKVVILDRPNPNGMYVDGPILDMTYRSGVGYLPIPVVHGMTLGELALMMNGEGWLADRWNDESAPDLRCDLTVIPCLNYTHQTRYSLILAPSPNLKDMKAIYLYPSTCLFEGSVVSLGRGTDSPFEIFGHPDMKGYDFSFTPESVPGAQNPPLLGQKCFGRDLRGMSDDEIIARGFDLTYLVEACRNLNMDDAFFRTRFFNLLTGQTYVRKMIDSGASALEIRSEWAADVEAFKIQRKPYLLYEE